MDDVLDLMHARVTMTPRARPGLSLYSGHSGIRDMGERVDRSLGERSVVIDDISLCADGRVVCLGHCVAADVSGSAFTFRVVCVVCDGLVVSLDSTNTDG
jgi:hypothetical protein